MKKKIFGVSTSLSKGIRDTLTAVENNINNFRFNIIHLDQIELDPENPRDLLLTKQDVVDGLKTGDVHYNKKNSEYSSLQTLAETIKLKGVINPIIVYKYNEHYRLVAGERRFLASHLAKKQDIQARILSEKPSLYELRLLQWIENNEREDLSLKERINNLQAIMNAYKKQYAVSQFTASLIRQATGLSLAQASYYLQILNAPRDIKEAIERGYVKNLDKAVLIASFATEELRQQAINLCQQGATLKELKKLNATNPLFGKKSRSKVRGITLEIKIGTRPNVIKTIVETMLGTDAFCSFSSQFSTVNWDKSNEVHLAFNRFLKIIETQTGKRND